MNKTISVVIPVFRSGQTLAQVYQRLQQVLDKLAEQWEIILVDDASDDDTYEHMLGLHHLDARVKLIRFARNMGQHHAILCGIKRAKGDIVVTLDDDLQNPPEEIPKFIAKLDEDWDMVIGRIAAAKKHSPWRNLGSRIVQRLVGVVLKKPKGLSLSSYRVMTRKAADSISRYKGVQTYLPALILGSVPHDRITNVDVEHMPRAHGSSNYSLRKLLKLTSYLLINHSSIPLRFATALGLITSVLSVAFAAVVVIDVLLHGSTVKGWASLITIVTLLGGCILTCIGIVGEYIGRLLQEISAPEQFPVFDSHD